MQFSTLLALALLIAAEAQAQTRVYVTPTGSGTQSGASWADARSDLATAMAQAPPSTDIWVAQGTYLPKDACDGQPCNDADRLVSFELRPGVAVIGGFAGTETSAAQASPTRLTVLSGDIGAAGDPSDNAYNVVFCQRCGEGASLANLTIAGGRADRAATSAGEAGISGAGLYLNGDNYGGATGEASPTLTDCTFRDNNSLGRAGAVYLDGAGGGEASPTFVRCVFEDNTAGSDGGAIYSTSLAGGRTDYTFTDVRFVDNATVNPGNSSSRSGGALYVGADGGTAAVTLDRCLANGNRTDISVPGSTGGNSGANGGFAYLQAGSTGAALTFAVRNSVLSGNSAFSAGAIYDNRAVVTFVNVTMTDNVARGNGGSGGGLYINGGSATVVNSISYGNSVPNNFQAGRDFRFVNGSLDVGYTLVQAADANEAFSRSDPQNNTDTYNEGAGVIYGTDPQFAASGAAVPTLTAASPAVDAGLTSAAVIAGGDLNGDPRVDGTVVDLGAVEFQSTPVPVELLSLEAVARARGNEVTWGVGTEIALAGYRIERSADGGAFAEVGYVPARGESEYTFLDAAAATGLSYYRLASEDLDGSVAVSETVAVDRAREPDRQLVIYPNPASSHVRVAFGRGAVDSPLALSLLDATGRVVHRWRSVGTDVGRIDLSDVPAGVYAVRAQWSGGEETTVLSVR